MGCLSAPPPSNICFVHACQGSAQGNDEVSSGSSLHQLLDLSGQQAWIARVGEVQHAFQFASKRGWGPSCGEPPGSWPGEGGVECVASHQGAGRGGCGVDTEAGPVET